MHTTTPTPPPQRPVPHQPQWAPPPNGWQPTAPPNRRNNNTTVIALAVGGTLLVTVFAVAWVLRFASGLPSTAARQDVRTLADGATLADRTAAAAGVPTAYRSETILSRRTCGATTAGDVEVVYALGTHDDPKAFVTPLRSQLNGWSISDDPAGADGAVGFTAERSNVRLQAVASPGARATYESSGSAPSVVLTVRVRCS